MSKNEKNFVFEFDFAKKQGESIFFVTPEIAK